MPEPFPQSPSRPPDNDETGRPSLVSINQFLADQPPKIWQRCPVTIILIAICCGVAVYSSLGANVRSLWPLYISLSGDRSVVDALPEVREGQWWRLVTPMFIHFGFLHIAFNMLWLKDIGTAIEYRQRSGFFLLLVLVLSMAANLLQFAFSGPNFGGMSGVVYGLFGYVWMQAYFNPSSGYRMANQTIIVMVGWFVLCALGIIPKVANVAHGAGLAVGMFWGFAEAKLLKPVPGSGTSISGGV